MWKSKNSDLKIKKPKTPKNLTFLGFLGLLSEQVREQRPWKLTIIIGLLGLLFK